MPRITRMRVTNIQYDNGKKQLPDIIMDANGLDTVLLLANGGGKTLIIQLIIQNILPNERMNGRRISDLLQSNKYTGHVAVEWLLDDTGKKKHYLCTGFCFTGGINNDQRIRYFNYYFDYQDLEGLNIENLPLINEDERGMRHPISYVQLKDYFKEETDNSVHLFDQKNIYQERLRLYQILPEEWKNIRDTNGTEGGVDKFFEKSKTTQQLVDNLLIPGVEDMVFQSEGKKKELVNAFSEYRNMLIEIPLIKKNIKDFDAIRENAEGLVADVQNLDGIQREHSAKTEEVVALAKTFLSFKENAKKRVEDLEKSKSKNNDNLYELRFKKESYGVFEKQLEYNSALQKQTEIDSLCKEQGKILQEAEDSYAELKALQSYDKMLEARKEVKKHQKELDIMDKNQPELQQELKEKKNQLCGAWKEKEKLLKKQSDEQEEKHKKLLDDNKNLEKEIGECRKQERDLQKNLSDVEAWFYQYKKQQQRMLQHVSQEEVLKPEEALKNHTEKLADMGTAEKKINANIESINTQQEKLEIEISEWNNKKFETKSRLDSLNEKIEEYEDQKEKLSSLLAENELYIKSLLQEKENVISWVQDKLRQAQENRVVEQARLAGLEEKWVLFEDKDYYIAHSELLKIKQYLQKKGLYVLLGSEWLSNQDLKEAEKEAYLKHQPLLPYTLIIENNQLNALKYALKQNKEWTQDFPLLFLVKSKGSLCPDTLENEYLLPLNDELFFYQPQSHNIFSSKDALQQYKEDLEQQLADVKNIVQNLIDEEDKYVQIREEVKSFYQHYDEQQIESWHNTEKKYREEINILNNKIKNGRNQTEKFKHQFKKKQMELNKLQDDKRVEEGIITKLQEYLQDYKLHSEKNKERKLYKDELLNLETQINTMENQNKDNYDFINIIKQSLNEKRREIELHKKDYNYYQLEKMPADIADKDAEAEAVYEDLKAEVDAVLEKLKEKQSGRSYVENLLKKALESKEEARFIIEETGVEEDWLQENQRWVSKDEVKQAENNSEDQRKSFEKLNKQLNAAEMKVSSMKSVLEDRANRIKADFGREPYLDFSETDHKLEYKKVEQDIKDLQQKLTGLEKHIKESKEWQRENKEAYEEIADKFEVDFQKLQHKVEHLNKVKWEEYNAGPKKVFRLCEKELEEIKGKLSKQKELVLRKFQEYLRKLEFTDNPKVKQFIRDVKIIMEDSRIYDYDFVETQFLRIFEGLDKYQEQYRLTLNESEKNQEILIDLCLRRARTIYESIMEIQKNSKVKMYRRDIQVIKMDWRAVEDEEAHEKMYQYLQQVLEDLQKWKQEGLDEDEMDRRVEELLKTRNLIQVIAPIEDCRVTVYKPRKESIVSQYKIDYSPWDEVCRWSGGEEYSIYITMFMIMISHIRQQTQGSSKAWKVIVADNPFGKASSPHILETVFQVAKSNKIQLICLTAHKQDSILQRFPVVYSLQLRNAYGKEVMKAEQIETGFYRYETPTDEGTQTALW